MRGGGVGGGGISVKGRPGSFGIVGGEWYSSQTEHQGRLIHDQRHGVGAAWRGGRGHEGELMLLITITGRVWEAGVRTI